MVNVNGFELHPDEAKEFGGYLQMNDEKMIHSINRMIASEENSRGETSDETIPDDPIHHPKHYTHYKGLEVIQLTEQMNFNRGNAVKYIARAGIKDQSKEIEDLEKAKWYIQREIDRIKGENVERPQSHPVYEENTPWYLKN